MNRGLDNVYFRIIRNGKSENVCFSDLTNDEMDEVLEGFDIMNLKDLCKILGKQLRSVGDQFNLISK
jgi:hypothetical protein